MATVKSSKANLGRRDGNWQAPEETADTSAKLLIKSLVESQTKTDVTLKEQLQFKKTFTKAAVLPITTFSQGKISLGDFQDKQQLIKKVEEYSSADLSNEQIKLLLDDDEGEVHFREKHKSSNIEVLKLEIQKLRQRVENCRENTEIKSSKTRNLRDEIDLAALPNSSETNLLKYAISCRETSDRDAFAHPMDGIKRLAEETFPHLLPVPPLRKRRRKFRRLEAPEVDIGETVQTLPTKWDSRVPVNISKPAKDKPKAKKMFTIKNGEIVELDKPEPMYTRLKPEEILQMPKFESYTPGIPSNVLYVKNLHRGTTEGDLEKTLQHVAKGLRCSIKKLNGKMRGQAFISCDNVDSAGAALQALHGLVIKGKPIVVAFAKSKT